MRFREVGFRIYITGNAQHALDFIQAANVAMHGTQQISRAKLRGFLRFFHADLRRHFTHEFQLRPIKRHLAGSV